MSGEKSTAFYAYPASPPHIGESIEAALSSLKRRGFRNEISSWRELDIAGKFISESVLSDIDAADFFIAEVGALNFNVNYEIGYAIGLGKRVFLTKNSTVSVSNSEITQVGIYDTLGYKTYSNADDLERILRTFDPINPIPLGGERSRTSPIYLNRSKYKTDWEQSVISRVKRARLYFRSFDPSETPRLSANDAIRNVAASYGVVLLFLPDEVTEARIHNLRAAFLAGLAAGMNRVTLLLQVGETPIPLDYRDLVVYCTHPGQIAEAIHNFSLDVTAAFQEEDTKTYGKTDTFLDKLDLGASTAENEIADLPEYWLETEAYRKVARREARLVTGRKGAGKTATFFRIRDTMRRRRGNVVLDLMPEGYQLLKFKDRVLSTLAEGTVEHTITAFWEYLLLLELCYKLLEVDKEMHKRDQSLYEKYQRLSASYLSDQYVGEGDFSERMATLLRDVSLAFESEYSDGGGLQLNAAQITRLLYRHDVLRLRRDVVDYLESKREVWLLIDNLDKGWPAHGLRPDDLVIIRSLIEATRKIEREFQKRELVAHTAIFLRNDVYELLIDNTPDRGKERRANVDWVDPDLLRELLRRRIVFSEPEVDGMPFDAVWRRLCIPVIDGVESSAYLIDRCLMRPRCLIDLVNQCKGFAVSLGHDPMQPDDISKGLATYSTDLISEISLEMRDVDPSLENVLYGFIGANKQFGEERLDEILSAAEVVSEKLSAVKDILFWFGFLGVVWPSGEVKYIYSVNYDMRLFKGAIQNQRSAGVLYQINEAFWAGLGIV
ncbi:conserved hypothetical protein [Burkholderia diffusa]|uniref:P-loop ATPase, Sll1717 family n=1 Tax=Burkholderia diffusa TaxID=488732 RepID=UPI001CAB39FE|nr:hypothetical protein [Burkholderia diffusa]CAG9262432.1 conserved hypothetical protein [Burkholderia diffusa]